MPALRGRVIAVSGAARGIGRATAEALEAAGARVARGDVDLEPLRDAPTNGAALELDVRDPDGFVRFLDETERRLGPLWGLVNNAGVNYLGPLGEQSFDAIDRQIDVNLRGTIHGMKAALPRLQERGDGHVVNVASGAGRLALPGSAVYCATKHAIVGLTEAARAEVRASGVAVSLAMPYMTRTDMTRGQPENRLAPALEPEQVATAIVGLFQRPRAVAWVPPTSGVGAVVLSHLPAPVRDLLVRLTGADRAFDYDPAARAEYHQRILTG